MDKPRVTPKDFFLWAGAMVTLYVSIFAFISLIFAYLDYAFPDPLRYYASDPYSAGVSYYMASLIVLFPIFLVLMRLVHRDIERDPLRAEVWIRRWALYLTLFVAGAAVAGDLITLIMYFFNGDVTLRFALKVLVILLVAGAGFLHFLADLRGYWKANPSYSRIMGWATGALVLVTIAAGFFIVGTPWEARQYRFDEQRVSDLQSTQYQVVNFWQIKQRLPTSLVETIDPLYATSVSRDPKTGLPYEYSVTGPTSFELCATFDAPTTRIAQNSLSVQKLTPARLPLAEDDLWPHGAGRTCFSRTIDPERYPPLDKNLLKPVQ